MSKFIDITGQTFGRLTVIRHVGHANDKDIIWECHCSCGRTAIVRGKFLRRGHTHSCGCLRLENPAIRRHGSTTTRLYKIWAGMKQRCTNPKRDQFPYYGGRGIKVCEDWQTFEPFRDWALANGYCDDLSIERIASDGNYKPNNCCWISQSTQSRNRSTRRPVIRSDGKRFELIIDAARETGCTPGAIVQVCQGRGKTASGYGWRYAP